MNTPVTPTEMLTQTTWGRYVDRDLLVALLALLGIGIVMLASASLWVSEKKYADPYVFLERQLMFLGVGVVFAFALYQFTMRFWQQLGVRLLPLVLVLLILVLIPGIGNEVNGSRRWLNFGFASIQVSELA